MSASIDTKPSAFADALTAAMNGTPLNFPGGEVTPPVPSREELLLSAKQWAVAAREGAIDMGFLIKPQTPERKDLNHVLKCVGHIERILAELEALK